MRARFAYPVDKPREVVDVFTKYPDARPFAAALPVPAVVERVNRVPLGDESPDERFIAPRMFGVAVRDDDRGARRTIRQIGARKQSWPLSCSKRPGIGVQKPSP